MYNTGNSIAGAGSAAGYEPNRVNHWIIRISGAPGNGSELLQLACRTCPLPAGANEIIEIPVGNDTIKLAGRYTQENISMSFMEFVDKSVLAVLKAWRDLVYDKETGMMGLARDYKKQGSLVLIGPDGNGEKEWELRGIWPSNDPTGDLDQSGNDAVQVSVDFACDKAIGPI